MPVTYFIVQFLNTGPAARSKDRVTSACSLLPGDYFIVLHYFIISCVWVVLHARLYSALLSPVTLNPVKNCCQNCTHRNWLPRSPLQLLDAASRSHGATWATPALATLSSKMWEVGLGESDQGGAGRKPWGDSHLLPALSQLAPPLPQSRKSIHVLSSEISYYFWIGNPEEFLTEA